MRKSRISFVLAAYNGAPYIKAQIQSVLACLSEGDELVISDDGSSDGTRDVVRSIEDGRITLLPAGGRLGYQGNFERAILASSGDYIFFSDQDDICLPERVSRSMAALAEVECVCGDAIVVDESLGALHPSFFKLRKAKFGAIQLFLRPAVIGATMAARRDFVMRSLPFPRQVPHDLWLSLRAASRGNLHVVHEPFILYRRHPGVASATGSQSNRKIVEILTERVSLVRSLIQRVRKGSA